MQVALYDGRASGKPAAKWFLSKVGVANTTGCVTLEREALPLRSWRNGNVRDMEAVYLVGFKKSLLDEAQALHSWPAAPAWNVSYQGDGNEIVSFFRF